MTYPWFFPDDLSSLFQIGPTSADARLACRLIEQMQRDPVLRHERICVEVQNRVVILEGDVSSVDVKRHAHTVVWGATDVHDVNNRLCPPDG